MISFKQFYAIFKEDSSYSDGTLGPAANVSHDAIANSDWYAPGDYRIPTGGKVYRRSGVVKRKKRRKYKK
jgi:hypothetical protein